MAICFSKKACARLECKRNCSATLAMWPDLIDNCKDRCKVDETFDGDGTIFLDMQPGGVDTANTYLGTNIPTGPIGLGGGGIDPKVILIGGLALAAVVAVIVIMK